MQHDVRKAVRGRRAAGHASSSPPLYNNPHYKVSAAVLLSPEKLNRHWKNTELKINKSRRSGPLSSTAFTGSVHPGRSVL